MAGNEAGSLTYPVNCVSPCMGTKQISLFLDAGCAAGLIELYSFSGLASPGLFEGQHCYTFEISLIG